MSIREKAIQFGKSATLSGIITEAAGSDTAGKPGILLLNSGILHRVGSCRFHVRLARALAPLGHTVLRFDYSGIGDSEQRRDSLPFEESAVIETKEAMDYLAARKGINEFVLIGLCSGADMAHETAVVDERVRGLVMLDAWAYKNFGWYLRRYGPKLGNPAAWMNFIRLRLPGARKRPGAPTIMGEDVEYEMPRYVRVFPPRTKVEKDLRLFMQRDMRLFCVWTGGLWEYIYQKQYEDSFSSVDFRGRLRVDYLPDADHILTGLHHQAWVTNEVVQWMSQLPAGQKTAPPAAAARSA